MIAAGNDITNHNSSALPKIALRSDDMAEQRHHWRLIRRTMYDEAVSKLQAHLCHN